MNREVICFDAVAPARERGLKSYRTDGVQPVYGRSREGAWIEIQTSEQDANYQEMSLPRGSVD